MKVAAVIPAAGQGVRMGTNVPKQFLTLCGKPILQHTLEAFERCGVVNEVVLAVPASDLDMVRELAESVSTKIKNVVVGGKQRQDSVCNGFHALDADTDIVVVHDGVRPFIQPEHIEASIAAARVDGAAIVAIPVSDTIKKVNKEQFVEGIVDRNGLWRMQTPQTFRYALLKEAYENAAADGYYGTDEGSLIERLGRPLKIITGSELNIKITRSEDLALGEKIAELLLEG
ncbi:2-C-methyl-D-erythritol 4-phosphate cytidylyltransferase [Nitrospina gracilis 3/211]|uniref:2-C-methyl-D-erythritol 4-phosphate cytidylyltransferase n=1 Tax=Nitrospina gracilis (strain 3/211) TaxID=1266370 RepID=M1ZBE0_NITG3|nr:MULTISPECIES: 2-C-methyl-D-erythritol 4-phosphate cytidylyltransferase [Nitrospina]MCF8723551.1 2-C-methyl-D-erythritol 4-phosphate cytidylyltransferase [Nitrospina sp. Nb-3]CCQ90624.1 2-C-methyl-D-erythritol 4-phosphate cytidylyltransferase [Nitrospina gracilis 3/211]